MLNNSIGLRRTEWTYQHRCYLVHENERFIFEYNSRSSVLNYFEHDLFYNHLVSLFAKDSSLRL